MSRDTPEQIIRKLREGEKLLGEKFTIEDACKHLEVSEATCHRWQSQYGGMKSDGAKRLKELEKERKRECATEEDGGRSGFGP